MDGPRAPFEGEITEIMRFLDTHLRPKESWSLAAEYPSAFAEANLGNLRIIKDDSEVLSHALVRPVIIKTPAGLFKVGGIGSVVTSDKHRNQGLSSKTIDSCIEAARSLGCDFAILWSDLHDFYRRLGFELAGTEVSALIDREFKVEDIHLKFLDSARIAPEALHRLYSQHTVTSLRTLDETRRYLQIPNTKVYTAWDKTGSLKAYAIEGKGADLTGYIHEWGGGVSALQSLLAHVRKSTGRNITVIMPRHATNLIRTFESKGFKTQIGYLGMVKILNHENLFNKIKRHARNIGIENLVLDFKQDKFYIGTSDEMFMTDSEQDIVRLIFGPQSATEISGFDKSTSEIMERIFPLNLWIWGWDSV
jgi:predicted acetyltransferase